MQTRKPPNCYHNALINSFYTFLLWDAAVTAQKNANVIMPPPLNTVALPSLIINMLFYDNTCRRKRTIAIYFNHNGRSRLCTVIKSYK